MTLNIMLTSRHAVYLTGDFRYTFSGGRVEDDLLAQKLVPVVKFQWCALVAFCGVAKTSAGMDVGDWISNAVRPSERREAVSAFIRRLQTANNWLSKLSGDRRLSISIVGFQGRRPFAFLLSNFENMQGKALPKVLPHLQVNRLKPKNIELRIFGDPVSVPRTDRQRLRSMLQSNQLKPLKNQLGETNRRASANSKLVSPECVVGCLLPTGEGEVMACGIDPTAEYLPRFVLREFDSAGITSLNCKTDPDGKRLNPHWKGMTMKVQGRLGKDAAMLILHALGGVEDLIKTRDIPNVRVATKTAGPNEPERYTVSYKKKK